MTNQQLRTDLGVDSISEVIVKRITRYTTRLHDHTNPEAIGLLDISQDTRILRRQYTFDLI